MAGLGLTDGTIGVRYARNCDPSDLWTKYFTSSKHVQEYHKKYADPDVIEVRQTFNDSLQAREWEHKVLRRLGVIQNSRWLNKTNNKSFEHKIGWKHSIETNKKISITMKGRVFSEIHRKKLSETNWAKTDVGKQSISKRLQGHSVLKETKEKIKKANMGRKASYQAREKMSNAHKKSLRVYPSQIQISCLQCHQIFRQTTFSRHLIRCEKSK